MGAGCCCGVRVLSLAWRLWLEPGFVSIKHMTIQRMEHIGIVVDELAAATGPEGIIVELAERIG
jgi:hypothetical protein